MNKLPQARTKNIVMQDLDKEILLYDLITNKAFCLNQTTSIVYKYCDGITSFDDLRFKHRDLTDDVIFMALDLLQKDNLLETSDYESPFKDLSRREVVKKVGLATMFALPLISSLVAPTAIGAASGAPCPGKLAPGADTGYACNFIPSGPHTASFCNQIECSVDPSGALCCSGMSSAVRDLSYPGFLFRCRCT
jgi:hypothetical protein